MSIDAATLERLRAIVGAHGYLDRPSDVEPFLVDHRKLYHGATALVLRPDSTEQVAAIMKLCNEARIGVVPVGGNTSYCGGATPSNDGSQIVLSLARMRRVRTLDPANYTMIAEAGCVLAEIQAAAASVDRLFPMSLGSEGSCQLGGNLSTNAGGTAVLRYGMMRDLVLGLEVVLPDGRVLDGLKPLRKDNTGYDLRDLFIGAEGTLGIITAAACKLFSRPAWALTAFVERARAARSGNVAVAIARIHERCCLDVRARAARRTRPGAAAHSVDERSSRPPPPVVCPAGNRHGPWRRGCTREYRSGAGRRDGSR
jgi:FAD/FMN-containing dehydrogenase